MLVKSAYFLQLFTYNFGDKGPKSINLRKKTPREVKNTAHHPDTKLRSKLRCQKDNQIYLFSAENVHQKQATN
ncbi:MAG: hypothetical protein B6I25_00055 [Planctomycetales bacterium 4572_13]|nr:MAG: hypothetical protein B6I25_00055 [Planctomycetales bacterium 4572_13]